MWPDIWISVGVRVGVKRLVLSNEKGPQTNFCSRNKDGGEEDSAIEWEGTMW